MTDWKTRAACVGTPASWWFPPEHKGPFPPARAWVPPVEALELCARCPVIEECDRAGEGEYGTWAGRFRPERSGPKRRKEETLPRLATRVLAFEQTIAEYEREYVEGEKIFGAETDEWAENVVRASQSRTKVSP